MRGMPVCCAVNNMGCMCVGRLKGTDPPLLFSVVEIWILNVHAQVLYYESLCNS